LQITSSGGIVGKLAVSLRIIPVAAALGAALSLTACGGSGDAGMSATVNPPIQGIAVGEPNPSAQVDKAAFIKMAQGAACSDTRNRLVIIDNAQVFWDVAGQCADASYSQALFGATTDKVQCKSYDSIAGPRTSCTDERYRAMFDTIVKNRDKDDLGLGGSHKIEVVDLTPQLKLGDSVTFEPLPVNQYSGNSAVKNVVVRDAAGWTALWKEVNANLTEAPPEPWVDFSQKMVLAVWRGNASSGCSGVGVVRTSVLDGVLHVEYADAPPPGPDAICLMVITSPVVVVVVDKFDGQVAFDQIKPTPVNFKRIDTQMSALDETPPFTAVVQDELKLRKLWSQYVDAGTPMPALDFSTQMVLFAWGGHRNGGCYATAISRVSRAGGKLYANVLDRVPRPGMLCTANVIGTGDVIVVDRTDEPVVFAKSVMPL